MEYAKSSYTSSPIDYVLEPIWKCLQEECLQEEGNPIKLLEYNEATKQNIKQVMYDVIQALIYFIH